MKIFGIITCVLIGLSEGRIGLKPGGGSGGGGSSGGGSGGYRPSGGSGGGSNSYGGDIPEDSTVSPTTASLTTASPITDSASEANRTTPFYYNPKFTGGPVNICADGLAVGPDGTVYDKNGSSIGPWIPAGCIDTNNNGQTMKFSVIIPLLVFFVKLA